MLGRVCHFFFFSDAENCHPFFYRGRVCCVGRGDQEDDFFLRHIVSFIFPDRGIGYILINEDNVGAIHLAKNPATTPNSKHINIRHHFIRERLTNGEFKVVYVPSEKQHADFLTKSLH